MLRFIFVCMGVVALSILSIATQVMTDGISDAQMQIAERNVESANTVVAVAPSAEPDFSADQLNAIDTAAGDQADTGFGSAFTNEPPKALADSSPVMDATITEPSAE